MVAAPNLCCRCCLLQTATVARKKQRWKNTTSKRLEALQKFGITLPGSAAISSVCCFCPTPETTTQQSTETNSCYVTAAGDWLSEATLLGLTGPKGRQFCNFCTATLSTLVKGKPQSPAILPHYRDKVPPEHAVQVDVRTSATIKADNKRFSCVA